MPGQFFVNLDKETKERFALSKFFEFTDNFDPLTSFFASELPKIQSQGYYTVQGEDERPALLANRVFSDVQYWWIMLMYNKLVEFGQFSTGQTLLFPSLTDLEDLYFSLKAKETAKAAG